MCLDEDAVSIPAGHNVVHRRNPARAALNDNTTGITAIAHRAGAPSALAHVVCGYVTRCLAVYRPTKVDAPRRVIRRGVRAHGDVARVPDVDADRLTHRRVVHNVGIRRRIDANPTAIRRPEKDAVAVGVRVVIVVRAVVVVDNEVAAGFNPDAVFETRNATIANLHVGRRCRAEQTIFANRDARTAKRGPTDRVPTTVEDCVARLYLDAVAARRQVPIKLVVA